MMHQAFALTPATRERFVRALPTLATAVVVTVCILAGNWQRDRLAQKQALAAQEAAAASMPAVELPRDVPSWPAWRFRTVELAGRYDAAHQILLDNRVHAGRVGYHVVTPLRLADGRGVLVNRGFVAAGRTRDVLPDVPPPQGDVRIVGRVNIPPRFLELGTAETKRRVWQNLHTERFSQATGVEVLPIVVEELDGRQDGLVRNWPPPDADTGPHRGYMLQWYAFAALALGLWSWFALRRLRGRRTLVLIAAAVVAPVALSYAIYHLAPREASTNYGELLPTTTAPAIAAMSAEGTPLRIDAASGLWTLVMAAGGACDPACKGKLYATRQARTIQGRERERVKRVWLVTDAAQPRRELLAEHPDLVVARTSPAEAARLPRGAHALYLIDPLANLVLAWPAEPDIKAMANDLARLLKASRIG